MTSKEKALQLFANFLYQNESVDDSIYGFVLIKLNEGLAKKSAMIAVNEIIDAIDWHEYETPNKQLNYWLDVRKEINNL